MTTKKNAAQAAAQAEPCSKHQGQAVDARDLYRKVSACGYTQSLALSAGEAQDIASRLRGIRAISALLIAGTAEESLALGDWMRGGLLDALHALAASATGVLERGNERSQKGQRNVY